MKVTIIDNPNGFTLNWADGVSVKYVYSMDKTSVILPSNTVWKYSKTGPNSFTLANPKISSNKIVCS